MEKEKKGLGRRILLMSMLSLISLFGMSISTFAEEDEFQKMEERWKSQLVFEKESPENESLRAYIEALSKEAENLYQTLDQSPDRTYLWPLESGNTSSADLTTQFTKLQKLTYAYKTKGTTLYQQLEVAAAIKEGIDFMITKKGYDGKKYYGNWWDWQIGIPQKFVNILLLLHQELSSEKIQQYTAILNQYVPDPFQQLYTKPQDSFVDLAFIPNFSTTGANRTDLSLTVLGVGILQKDATKIHQAVNGIKDVFQLVTSGDGFYADGSFIQHNDIPYTGSYGNVLIKGVGQIFTIVDGTSYAAASDDIHAFVENVEKAFIPLIYQGEMLPMVNGRAISRAPSKTKVGYGSSTMYNLLIVSKFAPEDKQKELKEAVKYWMQLNPSYYITNVRDYNDLVMTLSLLEDQTILGKDLPFIGTKMYHKMDRFVQRTSKYMVGISMYSNRISSFEAGNKENKRGWHTSDGMVYLYNEDDVQFGKSYWPTVDPYRLPGTTVDTVPLKDEISSFTTVRSNEKAVGGVSNEGQAVVGMALNKTGTKNNGTVLPMDVKGKKSWFVLDDQLIALGSGITGNTNASIETISLLIKL
nr:polysaccharide lyase 8 family protein [Enterococcus lactis]